MAETFQNTYRVPSARAQWHNYCAGIYFVTICCKNHQPFLGSIHTDEKEEGRMRLSDIGQEAQRQLQQGASHYHNVEIPLFVVMPNHVHAIIQIWGDDSTRLSSVVGGFKSAVTKYANSKGLKFAWQPRFHEHIIRQQQELNQIAQYIENNVAQWHADRYNPAIMNNPPNTQCRDGACPVSTPNQQPM